MEYGCLLHVRSASLVRYCVQRLHEWLSPADQPECTDLIFVLAGRMDRKSYGLDLFRQGLAPRILFSVARFEIRRFSKMALPVPVDLLRIAQDVPPPARHYFMLFQEKDAVVWRVPPRRLGTLNEVAALAQWLDANAQVRSLLLVSSATHLRRLRMCCHALLKPNVGVTFVAAPESSATIGETESRETSLPRDLQELAKVLLYACRLKLGRARKK
jgi:DUF218 domain